MRVLAFALEVFSPASLLLALADGLLALGALAGAAWRLDVGREFFI